MAEEKKVYIVDVTNRDGVQTSRLGLAKLQKTIINTLLNELGVYRSEFGFPFTRHETNYLNANLKLAQKGAIKPMLLSGWVTCRKSELANAIRMVPELKHFNISLSTSKQMLTAKLNKTEDQVIEMMIESLEYLREQGAAFVGVNAEDASRTEMDFLIRYATVARDHGANTIRYCDTLGADDPGTIYERCRTLGRQVGLPVELHCHNDLGMAVANSAAGAVGAVDGGVDAYVNTCVNGMGERAGNCDLVAVILALKHASGWSRRNLLDGRLDLSKAWRLAKYASYAFGVPIPINQPAVGGNAFAHESGIHADGALKDYRNYELYHFDELGRGEPEIIETGRRITVGEYSGIRGFHNVYEKMEVAFGDDKQAAEVLELVRYANVHTQKPLTDLELKFIAQYPEEARQIMTVTP